MVTYSSEALNQSCCCSFPWALADVLLELAKALSGDVEMPQTPPNFLLSKLNAAFAEESTQASMKDLALEVITKWAVKDELVKDSKAKHSSICKSCLSKIFEDSIKAAAQQQELGSGDPEQTEGNSQCNGRLFTAGELVLGFLRHVSGARVQFPPCNECKWSLSMTRTITMAAVRTYSLLAITRDLCHLGLPCEPELHEPVQIVQEGNPVRIQETP
uniref:RNA-dependent RNA polymerase n=1 Tax=Rhipicephalus appendiculatus TaxID=34631 RepID=A0A131YVU2_RHIAP